MHEQERTVKSCGIILRKTPFKESSLIVEFFSKELGIISIIAKGIKRENNPDFGLLEILNELEVVLHRSRGSNWFILKSTTLIKSHLSEVNFGTNIVMQAAIEIFRQLIISEDDSERLYDLLISYLAYVKKVKRNQIAIFWRFLLKVFIISGIEIDLSLCVNCRQKNKFVAFYPQKNGFICDNCYRPALESFVFKISEDVSGLIKGIYSIGNVVDEIDISKAAIEQINRIFLTHLSEHFHKRFYLKSIRLLK
ncbi:MAG: DNA repair protein RecO [Candidatus Cloacimonetes bacterium]|nr:DNA repair protein RecO [Candidatus Cloacimonadota bacterium]